MTVLDPIEGLVIQNFRSIRGTVSVPLDAPIVLIHGTNGAGKTSVLSALELALTREIPAMKRDDEIFERFLVHQGQKKASVSLAGKNNVPLKQGAITVEGGVVSGTAFLDGNDAQFFSNRCMLAQSTLSRLLKIYQDADPNKESALTHFVKDLLRLDQLDAVIDGLQPVGDVRNVRKLAPAYKDAEDLKKSKEAERSRLLRERSDVSQQLASELTSLQDELDVALPGRKADLQSIEVLRDELRQQDASHRLLDERGRLNELQSVERAWSSIQSAGLVQRAEVEDRAGKAAVSAGNWRETTGVELEAISVALRETFPDLPSWSSTNPDVAYASARQRLEEELARLKGLLSTDDENLALQKQAAEAQAQDEARLKIISSQIAEISKTSGQIAAALAGILPHIHDNECPVCGRDFDEVSKEPLSAHVQQHIAQITADAARLGQLSNEQTSATTRITTTTRRLDRLRSAILSDDTKLQTKRWIVSLTECQVALVRISDTVAVGAKFLSDEAVASRELGRFRENDRLSNELRGSASRISEAFGGKPIGQSDQLGQFLTELRQAITARVEGLQRVQRGLETAITRCALILRLRSQRDTVAGDIARLDGDIEKLDDAFTVADADRKRAKELSDIARRARTDAVRNVFNNSLNTLWRDLFVRLAPTEPFIPAFRIPVDSAEISATLETLHRKGMPAGTPGSMLSSGNLNTAALTLFLALHFSVATSRLPWLVLDDPVQSMDELHIAQFAALLRTISRNQHRKIIVAVHEKPLFDYLALELSPAFETDKLLTLEIRRGIEDDTQVIPRYLPYQKDAVAA
ncbi:AAA family ATPase [Bradyrhizobium sp. G127]|jgi:exonuclease SbcC|uniref:AAA family ATPase n=1 Tax=Bradyrhizobium sp. G127 TaxID=2904800 RepID=UPI001F32AA60|nr:AAA family ATPase [Bradyrhizobium sp. G127]MCF2524937.1 AAA family ATPase [Bradyrhizobium sp. G127]